LQDLLHAHTFERYQTIKKRAVPRSMRLLRILAVYGWIAGFEGKCQWCMILIADLT